VSKLRTDPASSTFSLDRAAPAKTGLIAGWTQFWFTPVDPIGLHVIRLAAGLVFLA